jgi:hypothetical protein
MRRVSEPPDLRELGRATGKMLADELAAYQDERRAEIVTTEKSLPNSVPTSRCATSLG